MIKAILLDIDRAVFDHPDRPFEQAFLSAFARHLAEETGYQDAEALLQRAIQRLHGRRDYVTANDVVIASSIVTDLSAIDSDPPPPPLKPFFEAAFAQAFAQVKDALPVDDSVSRLVAQLHEQGLAVAIVCNPIYPEALKEQRIQALGLGDYLETFAFCSASDNTHFAKAEPAFYAEVVARVGAEPDETLLISDRRQCGRLPAKTVGLHTWQLDKKTGIAQLLEHIQEAGWQHGYSGGPLRESMIRPQFLGNLGALYGLLDEVKEQQWRQKPDPDEWSILQILCHLSETETTVHQMRLQKILNAENPFIRALPPPGPDLPACSDRPLAVAKAFRAKRLATLALLENLEPAQWQRPARHSIFGLSNLLEMAYFTAQHDRLHITQLCQTLGKCIDEI